MIGSTVARGQRSDKRLAGEASNSFACLGLNRFTYLSRIKTPHNVIMRFCAGRTLLASGLFAICIWVGGCGRRHFSVGESASCTTWVDVYLRTSNNNHAPIVGTNLDWILQGATWKPPPHLSTSDAKLGVRLEKVRWRDAENEYTAKGVRIVLTGTLCVESQCKPMSYDIYIEAPALIEFAAKNNMSVMALGEGDTFPVATQSSLKCGRIYVHATKRDAARAERRTAVLFILLCGLIIAAVWDICVDAGRRKTRLGLITAGYALLAVGAWLLLC